MKNLIRKWLGIEKLERDSITRADVYSAATRALHVLMEDTLMPTGGMEGMHYRREFEHQMLEAVRKHAREEASKYATLRVNALLGHEKLVDDIVARVNAKQLTRGRI